MPDISASDSPWIIAIVGAITVLGFAATAFTKFSDKWSAWALDRRRRVKEGEDFRFTDKQGELDVAAAELARVRGFLRVLSTYSWDAWHELRRRSSEPWPTPPNISDADDPRPHPDDRTGE